MKRVLAVLMILVLARPLIFAAGIQAMTTSDYDAYKVVVDEAKTLDEAGKFEAAAWKYLEAAGLHGMSWVRARQIGNAANAYLCWGALTGNDSKRLKKALDLVAEADEQLQVTRDFCAENEGHRACPLDKIEALAKDLRNIRGAASKRLSGEWPPIKSRKAVSK